MKKFINQVELVEDQMIQGMVKAYPQYVRKLDCGNVVVRTEKKEGEGRTDLRRRLRPRTGARRLRRHGYAGCGGRGRSLHLAHAGSDL